MPTACHVIIIQEKQNDPNSSTRFFATIRLKDTLEQVVAAAAKHSIEETLFADFKELICSNRELDEAQYPPTALCRSHSPL